MAKRSRRCRSCAATARYKARREARAHLGVGSKPNPTLSPLRRRPRRKWKLKTPRVASLHARAATLLKARGEALYLPLSHWTPDRLDTVRNRDLLGGWTLARLAAPLGVTPTTVGSWIRGATPMSFMMGVGICRLLALDPRFFALLIARRTQVYRAAHPAAKMKVKFKAYPYPTTSPKSPT